MSDIRYFLRFGILLAMMELPAFAGSVTLGWNADTSPLVAGYNIYFWMNGGASTNEVSVGNVSSATISNLVAGSSYIFAATTFDDVGLESPFSAEVSYTVPANAPNQSPMLDPISDIVVIQGATVGGHGNAAPQIVALTGITPGAVNPQNTITITATSSKQALIPDPSIEYTSPGTTGALTFTLAASITGKAVISVVVNNGGQNGSAVTNTFTVTVLAAGTTWPSLTSQLTSRSAVAGQRVNFAITAAGTAPLTYQWQFNGADLVSATNAALTLSNVTTNQTGVYSVKVSNPAGSTNSAPAPLTVYSLAAKLTPMDRAGGQFGLAVAGVPGYPYVVQASADLVNWVSIQTNTAPFTFVDANAGQFSRRFYRSIFNP